MGTKIKEFRQYNNLFTELVRKGIKLKCSSVKDKEGSSKVTI